MVYRVRIVVTLILAVSFISGTLAAGQAVENSTEETRKISEESYKGLAEHGVSYWQLTLLYTKDEFIVVKASEIPLLNKRVQTPGLTGAVSIINYSVDWLDAGNAAMKTVPVQMPVGQRLPFLPGEACKLVIPEEDVIVVRVPGPSHGSSPTALRFHRLEESRLATTAIEVPEILRAPEMVVPISRVERLGTIPPPPGPQSVTKIRDTGFDANRLVMVVVGDGYTATNLAAGSFTTHAANLVSAFIGVAPWDTYFNLTNVYRIDVESNEQGADLEDGQYGTLRDTYFNSSFWTNGIERLLALDSVGRLRATQAADSFVGVGVWDSIFVLVNSTKYGGAGGSISVASAHSSADDVIIHEFAHSFADLADEYTSPYPGYPPGDWEPNVDYDYSGPGLKWNMWVEGSTPLPTPDTSSYDNVVGSFEGARYLTTGIYRPYRNCAMRSLSTPFCPICKEAHVVSMFDIVNLADAISPPVSSPYQVLEDGLNINVTPIPVGPLNYIWQLDGVPFVGETDPNLTVYPSDLPTPSNSHVLLLTVRHPTSLVRKVDIYDQYIWTLDNMEPTFTNIGANPSRAKSGTVVSITFTASESMASNPVVTVNSHLAIYKSKSSNNYTYSYTVQASDDEGAASIVISGNDLAGKAGATTNTSVLTIDRTAPMVSMFSTASNPTNLSTIPVTVMFSEPVSDFVAGDVTRSNCTLLNFAGSGSNYSFDVMPSSQGILTVSINTGVAHDAVGNGNTAADPFMRSYDSIVPIFSNVIANPSLAKLDTMVTLTFTSSETLSVNPSVAVNTHAATYVSKTGNEYNYQYTVQSSDADGNAAISISGSDPAGNPGLINNTTALEVDKTPPTVTIDQTATQQDPTSTSPITFTVVFSEAIDSDTFTDADVQITGTAGGTKAITLESFDKILWEVSVSGMTSEGTVIALIPENAAQDLAGNSSYPSTPVDNTVTWAGEPCIEIEAYVYLEGASMDSGGSTNYAVPMRTSLNDLRILPGQTYEDLFQGTVYSPPGQPYGVAPWFYNGTEGVGYDSGGNPLQGDAGYPDTVVDWVLVSLRADPEGTGEPLCQSAALLHNTGRIEFIEGVFSCCDMDLNGEYYLVVEHRSHLIVMSHVPVSIVDRVLVYDFRIQQSYVDDPLGFGIFARQKEVLPGVFAMLCGNGEQALNDQSDTDINGDDGVFWSMQNGLFGLYLPGDYNLNGDVNVNDVTLWGFNNGLFTSVPRN